MMKMINFSRFGLGVLLAAAVFTVPAFSQNPAPVKPGVAATADTKEFFVHAFHKNILGGNLECNLCHVGVKDGSVTLKRPGHEQCIACHIDDFTKVKKQVLCAQCHTSADPKDKSDLVAYPRYKGSRAILFEFSHASHVDKKARVDAKTGFRADCTFCHKFDPKGQFASFPAHEQCASCHSKPGITPALTADLTTEGCRGCHTPEEIENPGFTEARRFTGAHNTATGKYVDIKFTHVVHFKNKGQSDLNCTTCHYAIPASTGINNLTLPKMVDCVQCHDNTRSVKADFSMTNCKTCHSEPLTSQVIPQGHTRNVKPDFHNESFRRNHDAEAAAPNSKCFVCHMNMTPAVTTTAYVDAKLQCNACHVVMRPANHTARWKDETHGKVAALDRTTCATCHTASYCSDCHNELPRSHAPLNLFKAGGHALPAQLDTRSCLTCHTFQNTCSECHVNRVAQNFEPKVADKSLLAKATVDVAGLIRTYSN